MTAPERFALAAACAVASLAMFAADPRHRAALAGLVWSIGAVGVVMQLRLTTRVWALGDVEVIGPSVLRMLAVLALAAVTLVSAALFTRVARARRVDVRPGLAFGVALLALAARLAPAVMGGGLSAGTLSVPLVGSLQVGEPTRLLIVVCAAFAVHSLVGRTVLGRADRFLLSATLLVATGYVLIVGVLDTGPAALTATALLLVWWLCTNGSNTVPRFVLPVLVLIAGTAALAGGLLVNDKLRDLAVAKVVDIGDRFSNVATGDLQLIIGRAALAEGGAIGSGVGSSVFAHQVPAANSDMIAAAIGADLGALPLAALVLVAIGTTAVLLDGIARDHDPLAAAATALTFILGLQVLWPTLAALGLAPLTGISAGMLAPTGTTLVVTAATFGLALGATAPRPDASGPHALPTLLWAGTSAVVVASLLAAVLPWNTAGFDVLRQRGDILAADGTVLSTTTWAQVDGSEDLTPVREYPQGALFAEVTGRSWGSGGHALLEEAAAVSLTCGGSVAWWAFAEGVLHPVPCAPADVVTTIDPQVQQAAANALAGQDGAVVVLDSTDGAVMSLYSTQDTDPTTWTPADKDVISLLATRASVAPGSVFKPFVAAVGLLSGFTTHGAPAETFDAGGEVLFNSGEATCRDTALTGALAASCNTPFAMVATEVGATSLAEGLSTHFGFDEALPVRGLPTSGVTTGIEASTSEGAVARSGIGQESVRASPLGIAAGYAYLTSALNEETPMVPSLVRGTCVDDALRPEPSMAAEVAPVPVGVAEQVYSGMQAAVDRPDGTLHALAGAVQDAGVEVAGKSGTAQVEAEVSSTGLAYWTVLVVDRRWVVVALVLDGGPGDNLAKPVAGAVLSAVTNASGGHYACQP